jgi:uncharacterized tellurite resistance protein B-like protein
MFNFFKKKKVQEHANKYSKEEVLLVSASLAYEVAKSDGDIGETELDKIKDQLEDVKRHVDKEASELLSKIENKSDESVSFYDLVTLVNEKFTLDQKHMLVRFLWDVAYADNVLEADEERLIRRIADLLAIKDIKVLRLKDDAKTSSNN